MGWEKQSNHRIKVKNSWIFTGVAVGATSIGAAWNAHYRNASKLRTMPETDQAPRRTNFGDGEKVNAKPGADEQGKKWNIFDDDDDDTPSASVGDRGYETSYGGIDADFDAFTAAGTAFVAVSVLACMYFASRSRSHTAPV